MKLKKKYVVIGITFLLLAGFFMYNRFSFENKNNDLYNPEIFSFRGQTYHYSDVNEYVKYYQGITGQRDEASVRQALDTFIKNEVLYTYIEDLNKTPLGQKFDFNVSNEEVIKTIHENALFNVENKDTGTKYFSANLYKELLDGKGVNTTFFEKQLRKEIILGKFLNHINEIVDYNSVSKDIALQSTLNTRIIDTLKIDYNAIKVIASDLDKKKYYDEHSKDFRHDSNIKLIKYTFTFKGEQPNQDEMKIFAHELSELDGSAITTFTENEDYYKDKFNKTSSNMDLTFTELSKLLHLNALKIKSIDTGASFFDDTAINEGILSLYYVTESKDGDILSYEQAKDQIAIIIEQKMKEEVVYKSYDELKNVDFSKVSLPYLTYERLVLNPLNWKGDDNFMEAAFQLNRNEIAIMTNDKKDLYAKLVNIEPIILNDDEKEAFNISQSDGYKNAILSLFYEEVKNIYDYKENNLPERIKDFK